MIVFTSEETYSVLPSGVSFVYEYAAPGLRDDVHQVIGFTRPSDAYTDQDRRPAYVPEQARASEPARNDWIPEDQ